MEAYLFCTRNHISRAYLEYSLSHAPAFGDNAAFSEARGEERSGDVEHGDDFRTRMCVPQKSDSKHEADYAARRDGFSAVAASDNGGQNPGSMPDEARSAFEIKPRLG